MPEDVFLYDAHTHLGDDVDGTRCRADQLTAILDRYGFSRANVFCLDEPDPGPAFSAANDRTLACAERSGGRLVPYARLDLAESPLEEAHRALGRGARGIKLHPRAQGFSLADAEGGDLWDPEADRALLDALRDALRDDFAYEEVDAHVDDPAFAELVAERYLSLVREPV